eukprot:NODE_928_length_708_cov_335.111111_g919_i0.p1 GENE.NODE_928_length_708_cov_335.111111_g919_i0~~NODE_928_length_708_cov_335.111111_g919_i0.p1  ORF type:complete len:206 (-),score=26.87 NODE_928_length_708_cov_335.111111_g919_i0:90-707(-)
MWIRDRVSTQSTWGHTVGRTMRQCVQLAAILENNIAQVHNMTCPGAQVHVPPYPAQRVDGVALLNATQIGSLVPLSDEPAVYSRAALMLGKGKNAPAQRKMPKQKEADKYIQQPGLVSVPTQSVHEEVVNVMDLFKCILVVEDMLARKKEEKQHLETYVAERRKLLEEQNARDGTRDASEAAPIAEEPEVPASKRRKTREQGPSV